MRLFLFLVVVVAGVGLNGCDAWNWPSWVPWADPKSKIHVFWPQSTENSNDYPSPPSDETNSKLQEFINATMDENINGYHKAPRDPSYGVSDRPEDVRFYIYNNPKDLSEFHEIEFEHETKTRELVEKGIIRPFHHWKFLIHGFTQNQNSSFPQLAVGEYLKFLEEHNEQGNVVVVDWGRLAFEENVTQWKIMPWYPTSVENVKIAGRRVGDMIKFLKRLHIRQLTPEEKNKFGGRRFQTALMDLKKVHLIGFSLGAHVAGKAGSTISKGLGRRVGRVTGLDPAGPGFWKHYPVATGRLLRKGDSDSLDIIHTNAGAFGISEDLGDVDFYVNSGYWDNGQIVGSMCQMQPICDKIYGSVFHPVNSRQCSHSMAPIYFSMSINHPEMFYACKECKPTFTDGKKDCKCKKTDPVMGEWWDPKDRQMGEYYLRVADDAYFKTTEDPSIWILPFADKTLTE